MSQYLLLNRVRVQNANAVSGFTWGFPAITHFLGFTHNLQRKLKQQAKFSDFDLEGCAVIAHEHHVHAYKTSGGVNFSQNKSAHYLDLKFDNGRLKDPSVIEEAKMNMTVSLLIGFDGYAGSQEDELKEWVRRNSLIQRMAGGTVIEIGAVELIDLEDEASLRGLKRKLLPGFVLQDRSNALGRHFEECKAQNPDLELIDVWLDFVALRQKARPKYNLIEGRLQKQLSDNRDQEASKRLWECWLKHKERAYDKNAVPSELKEYFASLDRDIGASLKQQWANYCEPEPRPEYDLIESYLTGLANANEGNTKWNTLLGSWQADLNFPYSRSDIPADIKEHFDSRATLLRQWDKYVKDTENNDKNLIETYLSELCGNMQDSSEESQLLDCLESISRDDCREKLKAHFDRLKKDFNKKLIKQWKGYIAPKPIDAEWEYVKKPAQGYLVPIMTGYKAISPVYEQNSKENVAVPGARDSETDVCFVEAVHSIGEWQSVHRIKTAEAWESSLWRYAPYEEHWYLCKQDIERVSTTNTHSETSIYG